MAKEIKRYCLHCGTLTTRPMFCSAKCGKTYNNRKRDISAITAKKAAERAKWRAEHPVICGCGCGQLVEQTSMRRKDKLYVNSTHSKRAYRQKRTESALAREIERSKQRGEDEKIARAKFRQGFEPIPCRCGCGEMVDRSKYGGWKKEYVDKSHSVRDYNRKNAEKLAAAAQRNRDENKRNRAFGRYNQKGDGVSQLPQVTEAQARLMNGVYRVVIKTWRNSDPIQRVALEARSPDIDWAAIKASETVL